MENRAAGFLHVGDPRRTDAESQGLGLVERIKFLFPRQGLL